MGDYNYRGLPVLRYCVLLFQRIVGAKFLGIGFASPTSSVGLTTFQLIEVREESFRRTRARVLRLPVRNLVNRFFGDAGDP